MTRWNKGSEVIERLLDARHLEHVPADADTVAALIATARRHVHSATAAAANDPEGALALAYDAARKTATALLAHQGLRPTSAGGHIVIVEATLSFPASPASSRSTASGAGATRPSIPTLSTTTRSPPMRSTTRSRSPEPASPPPRS
jgi:hypothetical protein